MSTHSYVIAGHKIVIDFAGTLNAASVISASFGPFAANADDVGETALHIEVTDGRVPSRTDFKKIGDYSSLNTLYSLYFDQRGNIAIPFSNKRRCPLGVIKMDREMDTANVTLCAPPNGQAQAFSNALMVVYTFAMARRATLVAHASAVINGDVAHLFLGESGAGKSTHAQLWLENIHDSSLLNDDNPIIRIHESGRVVAYGSPWSGKTPCYRPVSAPVRALVRLHKAPFNKIMRLGQVPAFVEALTSVATLVCFRPCYDAILDTVVKLVESVPVYSLECMPDAAAAELCYHTICTTG